MTTRMLTPASKRIVGRGWILLMQIIVTLGTLTLIALNSSEGLSVLYFSAPFSIAEFIPLGFLLAVGIFFFVKQGYERRRMAVPLIMVALIGFPLAAAAGGEEGPRPGSVVSGGLVTSPPAVTPDTVSPPGLQSGPASPSDGTGYQQVSYSPPAPLLIVGSVLVGVTLIFGSMLGGSAIASRRPLLFSPSGQDLSALAEQIDTSIDERDIRGSILKLYAMSLFLLGSKGIPMKGIETPTAIAERVAKHRPRIKKTFNNVTRIFEEARFSLHPLEDMSLRRMRRLYQILEK